jgi:HlyD family secretion protein
VIATLAGAAWQTRNSWWPQANRTAGPTEALGSVQTAAIEAVTALGRLEPKDGVMRIAGPARPAVVIAKLFIAEGDKVQKGQVIAELDSFAALEATVRRIQAELANTEAENRRTDKLHRDGFVSSSERDTWHTQRDVARANLKQAQAELDLSLVRSPIDGRVIEIHAYAGERVGPEGIAEIGETDRMYAVAEVYETDITKVRVGQRALIATPALAEPLHGSVERIGLKIGKQDVLDVDPAAVTDARVVEVHIPLDDGARAAGLTNLQVEVQIELRDPNAG